MRRILLIVLAVLLAAPPMLAAPVRDCVNCEYTGVGSHQECMRSDDPWDSMYVNCRVVQVVEACPGGCIPGEWDGQLACVRWAPASGIWVLCSMAIVSETCQAWGGSVGCVQPPLAFDSTPSPVRLRFLARDLSLGAEALRGLADGVVRAEGRVPTEAMELPDPVGQIGGVEWDLSADGKVLTTRLTTKTGKAIYRDAVARQ